MINIHNISPELLSNEKNIKMYKCLECNSSYRINQDLIYHLETVHSVLIEREELTFENEAEFVNWKREIEKQDSCNYIFFGDKSKKDEGPGITKYICNKTGIVSEDLTNKKHDSCKQNSCISNIKSIEDPNGDLYVARVKTHYGHEIKTKPGRKNKATCSSSMYQKQETTESEDETKDSESMEEDLINQNDINLKKSIKTKMDILFLNVDCLDNQKLDKLNSSLDSLCHELDLPTKRDKNEEIFGQIIISNNSNLDHSYF